MTAAPQLWFDFDDGADPAWTADSHPVLLIEPDCRLEDVAQELGISRKAARRIECSALAKLRRLLVMRGFDLDAVM